MTATGIVGGAEPVAHAVGRVTVVRLPCPPGTNPPSFLATVAGRADLALSDAIHDHGAGPRDYAVSRYGAELDVICWSEPLARALLAAPGARLVTRAAPTAWCGPASGHLLRLRFRTPTQFRLAGLPHTVPDVASVFGGLRERWAALGLPPLPRAEERRVPVRLLHHEPLGYAIKGVRQAAFVGTAEYDLTPCDRDGRDCYWALARFGAWRGVGKHTSYGQGRVGIVAPGAAPPHGEPWSR